MSAMRAELEVGRQAAREAEERADERARLADEHATNRIQEVEEELRQAETIRRKLHNQVQELKGEWATRSRVRESELIALQAT